MASESIWCPVLDARVTREVYLEGCPVRIFCPEYHAQTGACRLRARATRGGPLSQLLERVSEHTLEEAGVACHLGPH